MTDLTLNDDTLTFDAIVYKVQTLADNGIRLTLDLPEQAIEAAAVLMALKRQSSVLKVTVEIAEATRQNDYGL